MSTSVAYSPPRRPRGSALPSSVEGDTEQLDFSADPFVQPIRRISIVSAKSNRKARPKVLYAATVVTGLGVLMLSQLMMSIALSDGAYTINRLAIDQKEQARSIQALTEQLGTLSSPQNLAVNAEALGMVQNTNPVWLRMSDGVVIGTPSAAVGGAGALGTGGSQVPNELLAGIPLVTPGQ